ncbi:helicase associated domain-containing protein [Streptomyces anulatus]|uniref:helicase associated domain-containing protein n=1 Tax=Streptomyces anulatus TaxID=1892 RepID=UPI0039A49257
MADLEEELAGWLRRQCADYGTLHPEQHHLLARIGITAETARAAQPPAPSTEPDLLDTALAHARTYADRYGHIAAPTSTILNGFRLGKWLAWQRRRAHQGASPLPGPGHDRSVVESGLATTAGLHRLCTTLRVPTA